MQNLPDRKDEPESAHVTRLDPALLDDLTRTLLPYLGPYSITTVKRAVQSTADAGELVRLVASHIDDIAKREMFMKSAMRIVTEYAEIRPGGAPLAEAVIDPNARPCEPMTPELAQRGEAALAPIIGPLASVLVSRYLQSSPTSREFFERLAGHLRTPEERDSFFLSIRVGNNASWRSQ